MTVALGIDTGGTYTDAALVDYDTGRVLCAAKALTTRRDLSLGIGAAIDAASALCAGQPGAPSLSQVSLVALSTTLATNAIVEGHGSPVCLVLIGYDRELIRQCGFENDLVTADVVYVGGGHDIRGDEAAPLDMDALRQAVASVAGRVEAFAVSGYFGVRNPAHEERAKALIEGMTGLPVTCGHELTARLNSVRRATTVALNARLVPLLRELIDTLRRTLAGRGIAAPVMVVKGDGSLVRAEWAMRRPIETILSGPAASVVGAWHLARQEQADPRNGALWVVDVGGTTTDIASLSNGRPRLSREGAQVGRWRTMVEAVDVHTVGLGGDSHVRLDNSRRLVIGPQRVVPLSLLAGQHHQVVAELRRQVQAPPRAEAAAQFLTAHRAPARPLEGEEQRILDRLARGPISLAALMQDLRYGSLVLRRVEKLAAERLVLCAGFTPTDALHALGRLALWDVEAARLGAEVLSAQARRDRDDLCRAVVDGVSDRAATALVGKALSDDSNPPRWEQEPTAALLLERALDGGQDAALGCALTLRQPLVAIGAPVAAYMPRVADQLHTRLIIPPHAAVANAVGAVVGGVVQRQQALISPLDGRLRLHLPGGVHDFALLEEAVAFAQAWVRVWLEAQARQAGAAQVEIQLDRRDAYAPVGAGFGEQIYLGTELTFTAAGRPSPAVRE
ncbi:MAG: hydantoinase/oxoprolinase family protein [Anaerolineae bacterium]|nr:hydantoinase/oxoprolinase family protein [Anaerolineae bacterium]